MSAAQKLCDHFGPRVPWFMLLNAKLYLQEQEAGSSRAHWSYCADLS